jgi:hypothetical protein
VAHTLVDIAKLPTHELPHVFRWGEQPEWSSLDGWLFHGTNVTVPGKWLFPKFVKGFYVEAKKTGIKQPMGYNVACERGTLDQPWRLLPDPQKPKPFGFYECHFVKPGDADAKHPGSLLLDYGKGGNGLKPEAVLRDYVVQVSGGNKDLYLGVAYTALGPLWFPAGYFAIQRWAKAPGTPPR